MKSKMIDTRNLNVVNVCSPSETLYSSGFVLGRETDNDFETRADATVKSSKSWNVLAFRPGHRDLNWPIARESRSF